ncbi:endonuclease Q family protein [Candidatus Woesearchaeota archaeon]|nr:endonuclease Q family protein [Candidatus Woesearchaeota archaeon]
MKIISDLHIHSRYSRACSKQISIANLEKYAKIKGVNMMGTGDFQHPEWQKELKKELSDDGSGIAKTKNGFPFVYSTEVSLIYTDGRGRRIHLVALAPDMATVEQITDELGKRGRLDYDGRPIFKIPCPEFVEMMRGINKDIEVIPAHVWTPWFGLFGSMSGFDSINEAFKDQAKHIHAIETGLSSDPPMNWRMSQLENRQILSFSDLHSYWPWRIGREATIFDLKKLTYTDLLKAVRTGKGVVETLEFFPEEGKYHYDGHRNCNVCISPQEAIKLKNICPVCKKPLTIGVLHRVDELADKPEGHKPKTAKPFRHMIPVSELISAGVGTGVNTQKVWKVYNDLIAEFGNEMKIALDASEDKLKKIASEKVVDLIMRNRGQKIEFQPGYDGEYGRPIFDATKKQKPIAKPSQKGIGDFC